MKKVRDVLIIILIVAILLGAIIYGCHMATENYFDTTTERMQRQGY